MSFSPIKYYYYRIFLKLVKIRQTRHWFLVQLKISEHLGGEALVKNNNGPRIYEECTPECTPDKTLVPGAIKNV